MWTRKLVQARDDDSGIALVAAMGVALIGISVASIVVATTVMAANDSGRDRLRTTEVHAAEAAIDATMAELEVASPCGAPSFSPLTIGEGNQETEVTVEILYYNDDSPDPITCSGGALDALPNRAEVTATAVGASDVPGIDPERSVAASLNLDPRVNLSENAALYSSSNLALNSGMQIHPELLDQNADVWIDQGHWDCGSGSYITGSLIMPDGSLDFDADCSVSGDIWVENQFYLSGSDPDLGTAGGNVTVRSGNLVARNDIYVGGDVTVGGSLNISNGKRIINGGTQAFNVGADSIPDLEPVGLPYVEYNFDDWRSMGFQEQDDEDMYAMLDSQWGLASWEQSEIRNCQYHGWIAAGDPIVFPNQDTVYDLRDCNSVRFNNGNTLVLYSDVALFMQEFYSSGTLNVKSGDGDEHNFWIIVPQPTGGYAARNIQSATAINIDKEIHSFWYSPNTVEVRTSSKIYGQIYGGNVRFSSGRELVYTNVGVPGVSLVSAAQSSEGFVVELVYKREVS